MNCLFFLSGEKFICKRHEVTLGSMETRHHPGVLCTGRSAMTCARQALKEPGEVCEWMPARRVMRGKSVMEFKDKGWTKKVLRLEGLNVLVVVALVVKNPSASAGDLRDADSIPGSGKSPEGGHGNPLQYSCLENPLGQRKLVGYHPRGRKELGMTKAT